VITKTCLTRPAFGVFVLGVLVAAGSGVGVLTGICGAVMVGPVLFAGLTVGVVDAGAAVTTGEDEDPPSAASALRSCEARPLSPPLASELPTISAVAVLEEATMRRKRVVVTLPAVSITQRTARVIVI
jgi:hypothetical protein